MINISTFEDLKTFIKNYNNEYVKNIVIELFNCLYHQSVEDKRKFNLKSIIDGNGSIMICENYSDKEFILKLIEDSNNKISWCISFKIVHSIEKFFQIGIIINNQYCEQYIIPYKLFDNNSIKLLNKLTSCNKLLK